MTYFRVLATSGTPFKSPACVLQISDVASQAVGLLLLEMQQLGSPKTEAGALFQAFEAWLAAGYLINLADDSACLTLINLAFQVLDLPNAGNI